MLAKLNLIPKRYKIAAWIALFVLCNVFSYNHGKKIERLGCVSDKLEVAVETITDTNEAIEQHNEDLVIIAEEEVIIEEARNEVRQDTSKVISTDVPECGDGGVLATSILLNDHASGINSKLQALYQ